jgi:hypothetical protein
LVKLIDQHILDLNYLQHEALLESFLQRIPKHGSITMTVEMFFEARKQNIALLAFKPYEFEAFSD